MRFVKRSATIVTVVFILLAGLAAFYLLSTVPCTDCPAGAQKRYPNITKGFFNAVRCPRCDDVGRATVLRGLLRRSLDQDLARALIYAARMDERAFGEEDGQFRKLVARSGRTLPPGLLAVETGSFVDDGEDRLPVFVYEVRGADAEDRWGGLVLFSPEGNVLDDLRWTTTDKAGYWTAILHHTPPRTSVFHISRLGAKVAPFRLRRGDAEENFPAAGFRVRARRGSLEVLPMEDLK
jgi:hypothetical protein